MLPLLLQSLKSGSVAQLNGELTEDFTTQSRAQIIEALKALRDSDHASRDDELLHCLLVSIDAEVVLLALEVIVAVAGSGRSSRKRGFDDGKKLVLIEELSRGWRGNEQRLELATCISGRYDVTRLASSLYFEFYHNGGLHVIDVAMEHLQTEDSLGLFNRLIREFNVPAEFRFALLTRIRFAKSFPSEEDRRVYVRILILAQGLGSLETEVVNEVTEVALKDNVPEGIRSAALISLTAQGRLDVDPAVASKVEAFLNGKSQHAEEFIRALVLNTTGLIQLPSSLSFYQVPAYISRIASAQDKLRWLEDELKGISSNQDHKGCQVIKSLLLSLKEISSNCISLEQCLMKIFEKVAIFGVDVFDAAAALAVKRESDEDVRRAFIDAMILKAIPSRWKVSPSTIAHFFAEISSSNMLTRTIKFIVFNVGTVSDDVLVSALRSNHLPALIDAGGYDFLEQLPLSVIKRLGKREAALDAVFTAKYAEIVKNLIRAFDFVPGQGEKCAEILEVQVRFFNWLLSDSKGNRNLPLLEQLHAQKFLNKLVHAFEALGLWWITLHDQGGMALSLDAYFSMFKQIMGSTDTKKIFHAVFPVLQHCSSLQITPTVAAVSTKLFQDMCLPNIVYSTAMSAIMVSMGYSRSMARTALKQMGNSTAGSIDAIAEAGDAMDVESCERVELPPMSEMTDFLLKLAGCSGCRDWILAIWRNGDSDEKHSVLLWLIHEMCSGCVSTAEAAARLLAILVHEEKVAKLARGSCLIPRMCELVISSGFGPSTTELVLLALDRLFDNDLFETSEIPEGERKKVVLWFGNVVKSGRHYGSGLLKLGVTLTRHCRNSAELVAAGDLNALLSRILELGDFDSSSKSYAFQIVLQLLEDHHMLHQRIVQRIHKAATGTQCDAKDFLSKLSDLAYRDPALFLQAAFETSEILSVDDEHYVLLKSDKACETSTTKRFMEMFSQLIAVFLARSDDVAMELFMKIFEVFPKCLEIVVQRCILDRVLESNCAEEIVCKFLETVEKHSKGSVNRALVKAFSSQPGIAKLLRISKVVSRWCKFMDVPLANSIVEALCELNLHHPDAGDIVSSTTSVLRRFAEGKCDVESSEEGSDQQETVCVKQISDASLEIYLFQQEAMTTAKKLENAAHRQASTGAETLKSMEVDNVDAREQSVVARTSENMQVEIAASETEKKVVDHSWEIDSEALPHLLTLLWLADSKAVEDLVVLIAKHASRKEVSRVLVGMLLGPGNLRAFGSPANGLWSRPLGSGIPSFFLSRALSLLVEFLRKEGISNVLENDTDAFVAFLIDLDPDRFGNDALSVRLLQPIFHEKTPSISDSGIGKLCRMLLADVSFLVVRLLRDIVKMNPGLSTSVLEHTMSVLPELSDYAMDTLQQDKDSEVFILDVVKLLSQLIPETLPTAARAEAYQRVSGFLEPLWIYLPRDDLSEAILSVQMLVDAPAASTVAELAKLAKGGLAHLQGMLPLVRKYAALLDCSTKARVLHSQFEEDDGDDGIMELEIRREEILQDSYNKIVVLLPRTLQKQHFRIVFEGEEGDDGGGLRREWFQLLSRALVDEQMGLFSAQADGYQLNPRSSASTIHLSCFRFTGRMAAKAILDGQNLDIRFTKAFYNHILGREVTYKDLDEETYKNLNSLLENDIDESAGLTFSVDDASLKWHAVCDLVPGGRDISVTNENKHEYVKLLADYMSTTSIKPQLNAFLSGFHEVISKDQIGIFNATELEQLISGLHNIDIAGLKAVASSDHSANIVAWFWDVVNGFSHEDKARLLKFVTGSSKVPFSGIDTFHICRLDGGEHFLPNARTCSNEIMLPDYTSRDQLKQKLVLAIREGCEGFSFM